MTTRARTKPLPLVRFVTGVRLLSHFVRLDECHCSAEEAAHCTLKQFSTRYREFSVPEISVYDIRDFACGLGRICAPLVQVSSAGQSLKLPHTLQHHSFEESLLARQPTSF